MQVSRRDYLDTMQSLYESRSGRSARRTVDDGRVAPRSRRGAEVNAFAGYCPLTHQERGSVRSDAGWELSEHTWGRERTLGRLAMHRETYFNYPAAVDKT